MELPARRLASWVEPCAGHRSCRVVSLARRFPGRPWLDTLLTSAAKNSPLAHSPTADKLQFRRRVLLHQQFFLLFRRGGATRPSPRKRAPSAPTGGCSTRRGCHGRFALALTASLRHSDHAWRACLEAGRAVSRLDLASGWDQGRGRLRDILNGLECPKLPCPGLEDGPSAQHRRGTRRGTPFVSSDCCPPAVGSVATSQSARALRGPRAQWRISSVVRPSFLQRTDGQTLWLSLQKIRVGRCNGYP